MRYEARATSLSWIPSEAVSGPMKAGFSTGLNHYDAPPPDHVDDVAGLRDADAFRFANVLTGWAEFDGQRCVAYGQDGGTVMGSTTVRVGKLDATFAAVSLPELRPEPVCGDGWVAFTQTCWRTDGTPAPPAHQPPPVRAPAVSGRVDDAAPHDPCRRAQCGRARRREPVPAPLGLRRVRGPGAEGRRRQLARVGRAELVVRNALG